VPITGIASIHINTGLGDDTLTIDFSGGNPIPAGGLSFDGGAGGFDSLEITGGAFHTSTFTYVNASDGSIALDVDGEGTTVSTISYVGLEPILSDIESDVVELIYTGGDETITISDAGGGQTTAVSTLGELTTFNNPSELLRIIATGGTDVVDIGALAAGYASIEIVGDGATDVLNFNGAIAFAADHGLTVANVGDITVDAMISTLGGSVSLSAAHDMVMLGTVSTAGGQISLVADADGDGVGDYVHLLPGIIPSGAVLYWKLDEAPAGNGTVIVDSSAFGNHGVLNTNDANASTTGIRDSALKFDGFSIADRVTRSAPVSWPTTDFTVSLWAQTSQFALSGLFSYASGLSANDLLVAAPNNLEIWVAGQKIVTGANISDGHWHNVVVTRQGSTLRLYRDGVQAFVGSVNTIPIAAGGVLMLGQEQDSVGGGLDPIQAFDGKLDEVTVFNRALSAAEVAAVHSARLLSVGGDISIFAADIVIQGSIDAGVGTVAIAPTQPGREINLGTHTPGKLGLTDAELDKVSAGTLQIGDSNSGTLTVSADITRTATTDMVLTSGSDVLISGGQINTGGGTLLLDPGVSPAAVKPTKSGTDVTASILSFGSDLAIVIDGPAPDTQYTQLNVQGSVDLTGVDLMISGSYAPTAADSFVIVVNDGSDAVIGTFNGLAEGDVISVNGTNKRITYVGGNGNDVTLLESVPSTVVGTTPSFANSGTLPAGTTSMQINFSESVLGADLAANYELRRAGADGLLGTGDDPVVTIISPTVAGNTVTLDFSALVEDVYRLTVKDTITDTSGNVLDGDADSVADGDWRRDFVVGAREAPARAVLTGAFFWAPVARCDPPAVARSRCRAPVAVAAVPITASSWTSMAK
jgi:hypothetical protein